MDYTFGEAGGYHMEEDKNNNRLVFVINLFTGENRKDSEIKQAKFLITEGLEIFL